MPIYSYAIESLTLQLTPRLKRILKDYKHDKAIDNEDIGYLLDNAARWSTFSKEVYKNRNIEIPVSKGQFGNDTVELGEIIKELVQETDNLKATSLTSNSKIYRLDVERLLDGSENFINEENIKQVADKFRSSHRYVKELQKDFNLQKTDTIVEGYIGSLDKKYPVKFYIRKDSDIEEVINKYILYKQELIVNEMEKYTKELLDLQQIINK